MNTTAEITANDLDNNGQNFTANNGMDFETLMESRGAIETYWESDSNDWEPEEQTYHQTNGVNSNTVICYKFADGSAIILAGDAWDILENNGWGINI